MRRKKCVVCGNFIESEDDAVPFKGRFVHPTCFQQVSKINYQNRTESQKKKDSSKENTGKTAPASKIHLSVSEEEYQEKKEILEYLERLTHERPTAKVYKLLQDYRTKYSFTFGGMLDTLRYCYEILEKDVIGDVIGIIPYYYDETQEYIAKRDRIIALNDQITPDEFKEMYKPIRVIVKKKPNTVSGLIDIGGLHE